MAEPLITRLLVENLATILAITGVIGFVALGPIGRALARRTSELEERVDFTERLLARDRDAARLPARGEG